MIRAGPGEARRAAAAGAVGDGKGVAMLPGARAPPARTPDQRTRNFQETAGHRGEIRAQADGPDRLRLRRPAPARNAPPRTPGQIMNPRARPRQEHAGRGEPLVHPRHHHRPRHRHHRDPRRSRPPRPRPPAHLDRPGRRRHQPDRPRSKPRPPDAAPPSPSWSTSSTSWNTCGKPPGASTSPATPPPRTGSPPRPPDILAQPDL